MNPRLCAGLAAVLTGLLVGWAVASFDDAGSAGIKNAGAAPGEDRSGPPLAADAELSVVPRAAGGSDSTVAGRADTATAIEATADAEALASESKSDTGAAPSAPSSDAEPAAASHERRSDAEPAAAPSEKRSVDEGAAPREPTPVAGPAAASNEPKSSADAATANPAPAPPQSVQVATASTDDAVPGAGKPALSAVEIPDNCAAAAACIDHYLWALYQRTPKEDTIKVPEQRKETVKKKGKTVTVTKTSIKLVDEDFTWKDPKAADRAHMSMMDYVIGGMDRGFKLKLFRALRAADEAGLSPGITSAFRDDYRQSLASGLVAAVNRSYHGGSLRGGYGHGLAADVVSVNGETRDQRWAASEKLWKWIDAHGQELGIARPYLDKDPPHVAPIDGKEYAAHHRGSVKHAGSDVKKHS